MEGAEDGFLLPQPNESDSNSVKIRVYFFNTPKFIDIHVSKSNIVVDVIQHIITLYKRDKTTQGKSLRYPDNPEAYELRLIDDDESLYAPFYEIAPLSANEYIGEFESLAFMEIKNYKPTQA